MMIIGRINIKIVLIALLSACFLNGSAQTYYYERVATVKNGVKKSDSGDGHFITFTSKGCYDSNKNGIDEGFGFRKYQQTSNGIQDYYGDSYFGKAYYYFNSDRSRLNVKKETDGTVYVYARQQAPSGVTKSSRKQSSGSYTGSYPVYVPPAVVVGGGVSTGSTSSSTSTSGYKTCTGCGGTGSCTSCGGTGLAVGSSYYTDNHTTVSKCAVCYGTGHCGVCHGSGKIRL